MPRALAQTQQGYGDDSWQDSSTKSGPARHSQGPPNQDPVRSMYSHTGLNILDILTRVSQRLSPQVQIGPVDMACAMSIAHVRTQDDITAPRIFFGDVSEEFSRLLNLPREHVVGRAPTQVLPCSHQEVEQAERMYLAAANGIEQQAVFHFRSQNGYKAVLMSLIPLRYSRHNDHHTQSPFVEFIVGFQADLSNDANLQEIQQLSNARQLLSPKSPPPPYAQSHKPKVTQSKEMQLWQSFLSDESHTDAVHFVIWHDELQYVSQSSLSLLGYLAEELIGKSVEEMCHPNDIVALLRDLKSTKNKATRSSNPRPKPQMKQVRVDEGTSRHTILAEVNGLLRYNHKTSGLIWMDSTARLVQQQGGAGRRARSVIVVSGYRPRNLSTESHDSMPQSTPGHLVEATKSEDDSSSPRLPERPILRRGFPSSSSTSSARDTSSGLERPLWLVLSALGVILQCYEQVDEDQVRMKNEPELNLRIGFVLLNVMQHEVIMQIQHALLDPRKQPVSAATWISNTPVISTWIQLKGDEIGPALQQIGAKILVRLEISRDGLDRRAHQLFEPEKEWVTIPKGLQQATQESNQMTTSLGYAPSPTLDPNAPNLDNLSTNGNSALEYELFPWHARDEAWAQWIHHRGVPDGKPVPANNASSNPLLNWNPATSSGANGVRDHWLHMPPTHQSMESGPKQGSDTSVSPFELFSSRSASRSHSPHATVSQQSASSRDTRSASSFREGFTPDYYNSMDAKGFPTSSSLTSGSQQDLQAPTSPPRAPYAVGSRNSSPRPAFMSHSASRERLGSPARGDDDSLVYSPGRSPLQHPRNMNRTSHTSSELQPSTLGSAAHDMRGSQSTPSGDTHGMHQSPSQSQLRLNRDASQPERREPVMNYPQRILPVDPPTQIQSDTPTYPPEPIPNHSSPVPPPARTAPQAQQQSPPAHLASIHVPLPDIKSLDEQRERAMRSGDDAEILRWSLQVVKFVERMQATQTQMDERIEQWIDEAILQIIQAASHPEPSGQALYARGDLLAKGTFPTYVAKDLRSAFSDFERSARLGYAPSWYRIGRDYETLGDTIRAKSAYTRGVKSADVSSTYRMGMAYLFGQLDTSVNQGEGVKLLQAAADMSTVDTPHPAYIYALLLAGELENVTLPLSIIFEVQGYPPSEMGRSALYPQVRKYLQRAAYLNLSVAQYKCGWCFEHVQLSFPFDPLMSVQYYSAASQGGEPDADMALSKWFLCGADGCFDKNEALAYTFAERAAKHHLSTAQFALGYYSEVGIGTSVDLTVARQWYEKAAAQGNTDAADRLAALDQSQEAQLSRAQHEQNLDTRLYSEHTLARSRSTDQHSYPAPATNDGELARKQTMRMVDASVRRKRVEQAHSSPAQHTGAQPVAYGQSSEPRKAANASTGGKKGPTTFSEMGLEPKQDRDCVIC
ncbi:hypothetical protein MYAM1_001128 [Malassezia yamatoensis]|uniref:PAS domain-containing protein n=1 Tax=Malassezia yamatoensis TaxID=253288 RepID=A0AAJ5YR21_9BASI|nr:hypothetical protein MYAM1_001128 [Malassezia yamatoensis]